MNLKLKVTQWVINPVTKEATLYVKDSDDNPRMNEIRMIPNPIEEVLCTNNNLEEIHFVNANYVTQQADIMDGDFLTHPLVIHYEGYS